MFSPDANTSQETAEQQFSGAKEYPVCDQCRIKKVRCGRERPNCSNCARVGIECEWSGSGKRPSQTVMLNNAVIGLEGRIDQLEKSMSDIKEILARRDLTSAETSFFMPALSLQESLALDLSTHTSASLSSASLSSTPSSHPRGANLRPGWFRLVHRADGSKQYAGPTSLDSFINNFTHSVVMPLCQPSSSQNTYKNNLIIAKDRLLKVVSEVDSFHPARDSSPPTTPPLGIFEPMIDPYFDNINHHMPIWSKDRFRESIAGLHLVSADQPDTALVTCFNSLIILILTAKLTSASGHSGLSTPTCNSTDLDLVNYFLTNAMRAVHNLHELTVPRLRSTQALLSLYLVAQIHWGPERACLFLTLATAGAKPLGLYQWAPSLGYTVEEIKERQNAFLCLYILDKSRCWIDGQPPQVPLWNSLSLSPPCNTDIDSGLLARAKLSQIEERIFMKLYSDTSGDNTISQVDQTITTLMQELQRFQTEYSLGDPHPDKELIFPEAELRIVTCALQAFLYWKLDAEDDLMSTSITCVSLFLTLWRQNARLGNHLTIIRILVGYASLSFFQLCSFVTLNRGAHSAGSVLNMVASFVTMLRSIAQVAERNLAIKKLTHAGEIVLNLCLNQSVAGDWLEEALYTDSASAGQDSLHMSESFSNLDTLSKELGPVPTTFTVPGTSAPLHSYGLNHSPTQFAMMDTTILGDTGVNLNYDLEDLDLQQWALELQDDDL